jgi:broad specificity phosphatase PhoE
MRHSIRLDSKGTDVDHSAWPDRNTRPWDTPISDYELPAAQALLLARFNVTHVVTSPFRRCLQTAAAVCRALAVADDHSSRTYGASDTQTRITCSNELEVDLGLGEAMHAVRSIISGSEMSSEERKKDLAMLSPQDSLATVNAIHTPLSIKGLIHGAPPNLKETLEGTRDRLAHTAREIAMRYSSSDACVLCVTHGDLVGFAAALPDPRVMAYCVPECSFVVLAGDLAAVEYASPGLLTMAMECTWSERYARLSEED